MQNKMLLIMGLPGSGKTTFAKKVYDQFTSVGIPVSWFNADEVRSEANDWDFSEHGRYRAAQRMRDLVNDSNTNYNIVDMVSPTRETRNILNADYVVWMNTIDEGRFDDTNQMFSPPGPDEWMFMLPEFGNIREAKSVVNMSTGADQWAK
jgi:adenylylsulfate kinase